MADKKFIDILGGEQVEAATAATTEAKTTTESTEQNAEGTPKTDGTVQTDPAKQVEATPSFKDEDILKILNEKTGSDYKSFEDIKKPKGPQTAEEKAQEEEKKRQSVIKYALDNKLYDSKTLESYLSDKGKDVKQLALEAFKEEVLKSNPKASDEDIQNMFDTIYAETEDDDKQWLNTHRKDQLQRIADSYLNKKYENILKADSEYGKYEESIQAAHNYKNTVEKAVSSFNNLEKYTIDDGAGNKQEISYNIPQEIINEVKDEFLNSETFQILRNANVSEEVIASSLRSTVLEKELPKMIVEVARSYASNVLENAKLGRKNIPVDRGDTATDDGAVTKENEAFTKHLTTQKARANV